ncbi:MAG: peptidase M36, fungalysin [Acidobacteria bacterium OLB17]|nr:MAG: peptidase M36, fungalysin [Acidobacteria bacterium OLB17]MCZ2391245.1 M36 family metallopeptidase [Acidobacteriota bacterium]
MHFAFVRSKNKLRFVFASIAAVILVAAVLLYPHFATKAAKGLFVQTVSEDALLPNYDIRTDKEAASKVEAYRSAAGLSAVNVKAERNSFASGEAALRERVPTLKIEYNSDIKIPEVIGPDVSRGRHFLTAPSAVRDGKHAPILIDFLKENSSLVGVSPAEIDSLKIAADYTNPDGNLSFVELDQEINGVPVFRGEVKAGFTKQGEMIRVINNLAPGLDGSAISNDFGHALEAVKAGARHINVDPATLDLVEDAANSDALKMTFGKGDSATTAEKMYFPTEPGVAVPAWRVLIWQPVNAFYIIVDAHTGTMLWRKNITEDQTQSATYSVYTNPNAMINVADNPFPMTPGPLTPNGAQGAAISRSSITRIGNEAPYQFNNNGWITDGVTVTDGNAIQAGLDRDGADGVDPNSEASSASRNFSYVFNPYNPNTNTGDQPVPAQQTYPGSAYQQGSITQLFYITNWYHDELYRLGFTEQARNFQQDNFGRGGVGGDRVRGEGQDTSGTNNANFSTPADGGRGRMQMYLWSGPNPDLDGNFDADVVIHEFSHGLSNRLHGNGSGLSLNMSRGMGEGWGDFYGHSLLSEPTDPINGIYTTGSYDTYLSSGFVNNYYYGIRRFPKAVRSFTGSNGKPHNPLTFADADQTQLNVSDGAFPRGPFGSSTADQVHNLGEIWSSALWEVRARFVQRLGWAVGNRKTLQLVTDGMKLAPLGPTFLSERDAIIAAAQGSALAPEAGVDAVDIWAGFATRGIGYSASIQNVGTGGGTTRVTEAFDVPNVVQTPTMTISDAPGNGTGFPDPGEELAFTIPLTNFGGVDATGTSLSINGGPATSYGTIPSGGMVSRVISYTVPANTPCGSVVTLTFNITSSFGNSSLTKEIAVGQPSVTYTENFDGVTAPNFPAGWTVASIQSGQPFVTTTTTPDSAPNAAFAIDPQGGGGGTDLTSPSIPITTANSTVSFRHKFNTEAGWDGGVLEISIGGGAFSDIITAGGVFVQNGYNGTLQGGTNNPIVNRPGWSGNSGGYITTTVRLPAVAAGQSVQFKWRFGADDNAAVDGWYIDSVAVSGTAVCTPVENNSKAPADFDGDGKTDVSVFRDSAGDWYLDRSTAGFTAMHFGSQGDIPTPGDFDGDGKADVAVWRPATGIWYIFRSSDSQFDIRSFGLNGDVPRAGDFDGDGKTDVAVYRGSESRWYWLNSSDGAFNVVSFGLNGDLPLSGDWDGDGKADVSVFRPSNGVWYWLNSSNGSFSAVGFGLSTDRPMPGDFDGDGKTDVAVWRPSNGTWYALRSSDGQYSVVQFGLTGDVPVPGDYDGDGKFDQAVYRGGLWYLNRSAAGFQVVSFGLPTDTPIPSKYQP